MNYDSQVVLGQGYQTANVQSPNFTNIPESKSRQSDKDQKALIGNEA